MIKLEMMKANVDELTDKKKKKKMIILCFQGCECNGYKTFFNETLFIMFHISLTKNQTSTK